MALIVLGIELPDTDEFIVDYGITDQADSAADYLSGWRTDGKVTVLAAVGPDDPRACGRCGCPWHGAARCENCSHALCQPASPKGLARC